MITGDEDLVVDNLKGNLGDGFSGGESAAGLDRSFDFRSEVGTMEVGDRFGFRGSIDGVGFFGEAREEVGEDRGSSGVEFGE